MRKTIRYILPIAAIFSLTATMGAQQPRKSPHVSTAGAIAGKTITIEYGRPYQKGRKIYGGLVPFDKVWRTGADEATTITTEADLMIGDVHVPKGTYGLFTIPGEKEWTLVLNKTAKQWGAFDYDSGQDLGRTAMKISGLDAPLEQLTITIEPASGDKGTLKIAWAQTVAAVDIVVH